MNRVEELTLKLSDDEITNDEFIELSEAVESDPVAANRFYELMRLESALRGEREFDLARPTMIRLEERLSERAEHRVMDAVWAIDAAQRQVDHQSRRAGQKTWNRGIVVVASTVVAALLIIGTFQFLQSPDQDNPATADLPQVIETAGEVLVSTSNDSSAAAGVGRMILAGETIKLNAEDDEVALRYTDGTEIGLTGAAELVVVTTSHGGKQLRLLDGLLQANVAKQPAGQPLVIATPHASVRVLGTRFDLSADKEQGTRLDMESGRVELVRGKESPVAIEPNQIALIPSTPDPIQIIPRPTVIESPRREMKLRKVSSVEYAMDGKTIVGFGDVHAVYWFEDDRLEAVPVVNDSVGKLRFQGQSGPFLAFEELAHDRLTIWNTEDRQPVHVFEDFARLPRFFTHSRDRNNEYVLPARKTMISPQGDWAAFEYYGGGYMIWHCEQDEWKDLEYKGRAGAIAVSPDGRVFALGHWKNGFVELYDVRQGKRLDRWQLWEGRPRAVNAVCFDSNGKKLVVASQGELQILDAATGNSQYSIQQTGIKVTRVAISPDIRYLAASADDRKVRIWDLHKDSDKPICSFKAHVRDMKFSPTSRQVAVVGRFGRVTIWDVPSKPNE